MALQQLLGGTGVLARVRTYISTRGNRNAPGRPLGAIARRELDEEIDQLSQVLDRRLDRDASYGQDVLLRVDGRDVVVTAASRGMCTMARGAGIVAGDLVLDHDVVVDLNALDSGSIEVHADTISFRHVDGRRIEIVTLPAAPTLQ